MKIIILCGGSGTRLWPMSRQKRPKQFYPVLSSDSMIRDTYNRFRTSFPLEDIYFSTNHSFALFLKEIFPEIPSSQYILEPQQRDSAAAIGFVATFLSLQFPNEPIAFVCSDHCIGDTERFLATLRLAEKLIKKEKKLVDIGIHPVFPSTVLGYIHVGKELPMMDGMHLFEFRAHKEKPDFARAQEYIESGEYFWHSGYYMWTPERFLESFQIYRPDMHEIFVRIRELLKTKDDKRVMEEYQKLEKISFDYAVTEKIPPSNMIIIQGDFGWSDIGAWDALYDQLFQKADENKNVVKGKWMGLHTSGCLIYGPKDKLIATLGLDDLIIVDTGDVLFVGTKGKAQEVKKLIAKLKESEYEEYL